MKIVRYDYKNRYL